MISLHAYLNPVEFRAYAHRLIAGWSAGVLLRKLAVATPPRRGDYAVLPGDLVVRAAALPAGGPGGGLQRGPDHPAVRPAPRPDRTHVHPPRPLPSRHLGGLAGRAERGPC